MRLLHYLTPLLYLMSSIHFESSSASVFLPTPAPTAKSKIPIIKRRKVKKKQKSPRQMSSGDALDKLLQELELLPVPEELMQRSPDNSIIIRRTKKLRRKKNLQPKDDVIKNVEQIQRDLSLQIQKKRLVNSSTFSPTRDPKVTSKASSRVPKAISHLKKRRPKDSFVSETRTLTKYTPEHHIKPMVFFKQVSPVRISPGTTTTSTPTFPHFPVRNMSTPPTFMTREPSSTIQFKKKSNTIGYSPDNELKSVTEKTNLSTSFWIAPTKRQNEEPPRAPREIPQLRINKEVKPRRSSFIAEKAQRNITTQKDLLNKPIRLHLTKSHVMNSSAHEEIKTSSWKPLTEHRELLKRKRKKFVRNKINPSQSNTKSVSHIKVQQQTTVFPWKSTTHRQVTLKSIEGPNTSFSQPYSVYRNPETKTSLGITKDISHLKLQQKTTALPWTPTSSSKVALKSTKSPKSTFSQPWTSYRDSVYKSPETNPSLSISKDISPLKLHQKTTALPWTPTTSSKGVLKSTKSPRRTFSQPWTSYRDSVYINQETNSSPSIKENSSTLKKQRQTTSLPTTPPKVVLKSTDSLRNSFSQPWTSFRDSKVYRNPEISQHKSSRNPKQNLHSLDGFQSETTKLNEYDRHFSSWKTTPSPIPSKGSSRIRMSTTSTTTTIKPSKTIEPESLPFKSQSEWAPFVENENNGLRRTKSPVYFPQTLSPGSSEGLVIPTVFQSNSWNEKDNLELKESFASWNPPSFQNLESEIYSSSWNEDPIDNNSEPSRNQRQKKVDPIWNNPKPLVHHLRPPSPSKNVEVREIKNEDLQSFSKPYRRPPIWNHHAQNVYDRREPLGRQNNDWDVPNEYKKLLVYDPYAFHGNLDKIPPSSIELDDTSAYIKPGPPYSEDELTQYVPQLVSTPTDDPRLFPKRPDRVPKVIQPPSEDLSPINYASKIFSPPQHENPRSTYGRGFKDSDLVDYGAYSGSHGAFGWYADFPVAIH